jgi:hypothetical protein
MSKIKEMPFYRCENKKCEKSQLSANRDPIDHSFDPVIMESSYTVCDMVANKVTIPYPDLELDCLAIK